MVTKSNTIRNIPLTIYFYSEQKKTHNDLPRILKTNILLYKYIAEYMRWYAARKKVFGSPYFLLLVTMKPPRVDSKCLARTEAIWLAATKVYLCGWRARTRRSSWPNPKTPRYAAAVLPSLPLAYCGSIVSWMYIYGHRSRAYATNSAYTRFVSIHFFCARNLEYI